MKKLINFVLIGLLLCSTVTYRSAAFSCSVSVGCYVSGYVNIDGDFYSFAYGSDDSDYLNTNGYWASETSAQADDWYLGSDWYSAGVIYYYSLSQTSDSVNATMLWGAIQGTVTATISTSTASESGQDSY